MFGSNGTAGPWIYNGAYTAGANQRTEGSADYVTRIRAYITAETRQQTAYGTLRTYLNVGVNLDSPGNQGILAQSAGGFSANRAFIQIAGFTIGLATSYYDFYSAPATGYFAPPSSDAGDGGVRVMAYTAQLGNGVSTSISLEDPRRLVDFNTTGVAPSTVLAALPNTANSYEKVMMPDIVGNIRVDQAWGSAQIMAVLHDASPGYYFTPGSPLIAAQAGHPSDKLGFAVGAGIRINTPWISPGDYFQAQVNYANGAGRYVATSLGSVSPFARNGGSFGYGFNSDGVYTSLNNQTGSDLQLTTSWGVNAAYEHFWTPAVRTSLYGSYYKTSYNDVANAALCAAVVPTTNVAAFLASCNNNYSWWTIGSRSQWNITKDFYIGMDVIYMRLQTANKGFVGGFTGTGTMPTGIYTIDDQSVWALRFRAHRDIVP
jgi:Porin subfamily